MDGWLTNPNQVSIILGDSFRSNSEVNAKFNFGGKGPFLATRIYYKTLVLLVTFITWYANRQKYNLKNKNML